MMASGRPASYRILYQELAVKYDDLVRRSRALSRDLDDRSKVADMLSQDIDRIHGKLALKDEIIDFLHKENKLLLQGIPLLGKKDQYEWFIAYFQTYYKMPRELFTPFIKQILSYFLVEVYKLTYDQVAIELDYSDRSAAFLNVKKVKETMEFDNEMLKDIFDHRTFIRKLNNE